MGYIINNEICHWGIKGQKWGIRRFQNEDGTLTREGLLRYNDYSKENRRIGSQQSALSVAKRRQNREIDDQRVYEINRARINSKYKDGSRKKTDALMKIEIEKRAQDQKREIANSKLSKKIENKSFIKIAAKTIMKSSIGGMLIKSGGKKIEKGKKATGIALKGVGYLTIASAVASAAYSTGNRFARNALKRNEAVKHTPAEDE